LSFLSVVVLDHLGELLDAPNLLDPARSLEEKRVEIIRKWTKYGSAMDAIEHLALANFDHEIPEQYKQPHPEEWKSGERAYVSLGPNTRYDLSEIDVDAAAKHAEEAQGKRVAQTVRETCQRTNIGRRFWIHLQQEDLRWLVSKTLAIAQMIKQESQELLRALQAVIDLNSPEYVRVQLLVTNKGKRAVAIKPFACLTIPGIDPVTDARAIVPLVPEGSSHSAPAPVLVPGNGATQVTFVSEEHLAALKIKDSSGTVVLTGERLRNIYEGQVVPCRAAVSFMGLGRSGAPPIVSEAYRFGITANTQVRKEMANALAS